MAKKLAKILAGINCLLLVAVVYFINVNDNRMVVLTAKIFLAIFIIFLFISLIFRMAETDGKVWPLVAIIGGFVLAGLLYLGVGQIAIQIARRDLIAGLGELEFFKHLVLGGISLSCLTTLLCGLAGTKGGHHG